MEVDVEVLDVDDGEARALLLSIDPLAALADYDSQTRCGFDAVTDADSDVLANLWRSIASADAVEDAGRHEGQGRAEPAEQFLVLIECIDEAEQFATLPGGMAEMPGAVELKTGAKQSCKPSSLSSRPSWSRRACSRCAGCLTSRLRKRRAFNGLPPCRLKSGRGTSASLPGRPAAAASRWPRPFLARTCIPPRYPGRMIVHARRAFSRKRVDQDVTALLSAVGFSSPPRRGAAAVSCAFDRPAISRHPRSAPGRSGSVRRNRRSSSLVDPIASLTTPRPRSAAPRRRGPFAPITFASSPSPAMTT